MMKVPCVLIVLISYAAIDNVQCQLPEMPPMPQLPPVPGLLEPRFRRSAQEPPAPPPTPLEGRVRRSAQEPPAPPMPPTPLEERVRRSAQGPEIATPPMPPMPMEERYRRSASTPITSALQQMNIVDVASEYFGIRDKREARGGRMPTTNG